jgi:apolipoprotein N-acyltransferase
MHISVPPLRSTHIYIITMHIFFVHYGFGLFWLLFVKVVLILVFWCLVLCVVGYVLYEGLFFLFAPRGVCCELS